MANVVVVYCGGRGSGKTLSMSAQAALDLMGVRGGLPLRPPGKRNVFSNYPIKFSVKYGDDDDIDVKEELFESKIIDIQDLISFREDIRHGTIALDELNLWASNRGSMTLLNRLLNGWIQLIRKRDLNIYITCQDIDSLDRFFRWQTDCTVNCFDMHFFYNNLAEGAYINQSYTDWSGIYTGHPLTHWADKYDIFRNKCELIFKGELFWGIYDSWQEVDIIDAITPKYELQRDIRIVGKVHQLNYNVMDALQSVGFEKGTPISADELFNQFKQAGFKGSKRDFGKAALDMGFLEMGGNYEMPHE